MLLELPAPMRRIHGVLHVELQAHNGLQQWMGNFEHVTLCAPLVPEPAVDPTTRWLPASDLLAQGRLTIHELPWGYHPFEHYRHRRDVTALFRQLIASHQHLCFSNLGWLGGWGNLAADEAHRADRPYAVWLDWVLHEMSGPQRHGIARRAFDRLHAHLLKRNSLRAVRQAAIGLFHGQSVFEAYHAHCRRSEVVHDIHLKAADVISEPQLTARLDRDDRVVRIGYVGRVHAMKGPLQWIDAVEDVTRRCEQAPASTRVRIEATWLGDGPLLAEARGIVQQRGLQGHIRFEGQQDDRRKVLAFLRGLDLFAFCHLTPESPRCLIESLMSGVPLVGYDSPYAQDLVRAGGGGRFVPTGDVPALADALFEAATNRDVRRRQSARALNSGKGFSDAAVFRHRSELIKSCAA